MRLHSFWAGFFSGLRSGTPLALTARAANMGTLDLPGPTAIPGVRPRLAAPASGLVP